MAEELVPVFDHLAPVYGVDGGAEATARYAAISKAFQDRFSVPPELFARAPGRVNLIGEHIDYEGYSVLPMAIKQDTVVAIRKGGDQLVITNLDRERFPDVTFSIDPAQQVDTSNHTWANYFLAAYKGVFEYLGKQGSAPQPVGLQVVLHGVVPTGSGLSSSAAFTCSASLAILGAFGLPATKGDVAEFATTCERYVGTESGGMDQAIAMMGMPGVAKVIDFHPVRASDVMLPEGATFVIANSLTVSNKAETAAARYNMRVVECRLAAMVLAEALGQPKEEAVKVMTLRQIEPLIDAKFSGPKGGVTGAPLAAVEQLLHDGAYVQDEIEGLLGAPLDRIFGANASQMRVLPLAAGAGGFRLRQRAAHVYAEAARVPAFRDVCHAEGVAAADKLARLGALMDDSQASCRDLYQCSCEELDALVGVAKRAGALGARLTGAGWGGCTVSLVTPDRVDGFIQQVKQEYYAACVAAGKVTDAQLDSCIFASKPSSGGAILKLKDLHV